MVPNRSAVWVWRPRAGERRCHAQHHVNLLPVDLDALDQQPDQVPLRAPIHHGHPLPDLPGEVLQPADDQRQHRELRRLVPQPIRLFLKAP